MNISRMGGRRVLFTARFLNSCGVTTYMATLGRALIRNGWEVGLCSSGQSEDHTFGPGKFESLGIRHFSGTLSWSVAVSLQSDSASARDRRPAQGYSGVSSFLCCTYTIAPPAPFAAVADNCWGTPFVSHAASGRHPGYCPASPGLLLGPRSLRREQWDQAVPCLQVRRPRGTGSHGAIVRR